MALRMDSTEFLPQFSSDGGTTWLTLICLEDWSLDGSTPTDEVDTLTCGKLFGLGAPGYTGNANAIADKTPSGTEVSAELAQSWWFNKTALKFRAQAPLTGTPGTDLYVASDARINAYSVSGTAGQYVRFTLGWTNENLDITP